MLIHLGTLTLFQFAGELLSMAVSANGFVRTKTIPLLTVEEAEEALAKSRTR